MRSTNLAFRVLTRYPVKRCVAEDFAIALSWRFQIEIENGHRHATGAADQS